MTLAIRGTLRCCGRAVLIKRPDDTQVRPVSEVMCLDCWQIEPIFEPVHVEVSEPERAMLIRRADYMATLRARVIEYLTARPGREVSAFEVSQALTARPWDSWPIELMFREMAEAGQVEVSTPARPGPSGWPATRWSVGPLGEVI